MDAIDRHAYAEGRGRPSDRAGGERLHAHDLALADLGGRQVAGGGQAVHHDGVVAGGPQPVAGGVSATDGVLRDGAGGLDASYAFSAGDTAFFRSGWADLSAYLVETPLVMGQFPAPALAVRRGDFAEGGAVSRRRMSPDDAFSGTDATRSRGPTPRPASGTRWDGVSTKVGDGRAQHGRMPAA